MCPGLGLEHSQQLELTPEVREGIEIMAMPLYDLRALIYNKTMSNPFLKLDESFETRNGDTPNALGKGALESMRQDDERSFDDCAEAGQMEGFRDQGTAEPRGFFAEDPYDELSKAPDDASSLEESILDQMRLDLRSREDMAIAEELLHGIDEAGYLRADTDIIADKLHMLPDRVEGVLKAMRTECVPAGIGARSLQERLLAQLSARHLDDELTRIIVENHLNELASGNFSKIARMLDVSTDDVRESLERIRSLDPHPAAAFSRESPFSYPEVMVIGAPGNWTVKLRKGLLPKVLIDEGYESLLDDVKNPLEGIEKMRTLLREAHGFVRAIDMRNASIHSIASAIVDAQSDFFDHGITGLHPLTMMQIASVTRLSESTVSRVANGVTMDTPRGIIAMRYFFHSRVGSNLESDGMSSVAVKQAIRELIDTEDRRHPLSDTRIVQILSERGIDLSRRTVNKYRTSMGILSSSKRRIVY